MGDEYQLRKDIDTIKTAINQLDLEKISSDGIATIEYVSEILDGIDEGILSRIGLNQTPSYKFNFATITKQETALDQSIITDEEFWILSNAFYDYERNRFIKIDAEHTSFGIQIQANGSYPGEAQLGYADNVGINIWRNPKKSDIEASFPNWRTDSYYDFYPFMEDSEIGLGLRSDSSYWREFGVYAGWSNSFMVDSYGGMTIGGAGFEVDGNGIFPFTRLSSSRYSDENGKVWHLLGLLDNAYHPTKWGWSCDDNSTWSWFVGFRTPEKSEVIDGQTVYSDLVKDNSLAKFVVMYNDTPHNPLNREQLIVTNWHTVLEVSPSDIKGMVNGTLTALGSGGGGGSIDDSGWIALSKQPVFWNFDAAYKVRYRKYGNIVQVQGLTQLSETQTSTADMVIGQLPGGYRPTNNEWFLQEMYNNGDVWTCKVNTYGEIILSRVRNSNGAVIPNNSHILNINITFLV